MNKMPMSPYDVWLTTEPEPTGNYDEIILEDINGYEIEKDRKYFLLDDGYLIAEPDFTYEYAEEEFKRVIKDGKSYFYDGYDYIEDDKDAVFEDFYEVWGRPYDYEDILKREVY